MKQYGGKKKMASWIPETLSNAMGIQMYAAVFHTENEMNDSYGHVLECENYERMQNMSPQLQSGQKT